MIEKAPMHLNLKQLNDPCQFTPDIKPFGRLSLNTTVDVCPSQEDPLGDMGSVKGHIKTVRNHKAANCGTIDLP